MALNAVPYRYKALLILMWFSRLYISGAYVIVAPKTCYRRHTPPPQQQQRVKISVHTTSSAINIRPLRLSKYDDFRRMDDENNNDIVTSDDASLPFHMVQNRRDMMIHSLLLYGSGIATTTTIPNMIPIANAIEINKENAEETVPVLKTSSGLKYIDIVPGTGISPTYGNLCSVSYTAYVKLPNNNLKYSTKPQRYDHCDGYLIKHGNGRMIAGLDEGIHTMKVGGTRRLLIPPKLGFIDTGLGPLPDLPWNRNHLNKLLDQMIDVSGGTMIYEVTLLSVIPDEADLGYYTDASLSPEDFNTLRENLRVSGNEGRIQEEAEEMAKNTIKGQDRLL